MRKTSILLLIVSILCGCSQARETEKEQPPEPHILVIFGATGDLTQRKLIPALFNLALHDQLPRHFLCVGIGRRAKTSAEFQKDIAAAIETPNSGNKEKIKGFQERFLYFQGDFEAPGDYERLGAYLAGLDRQRGTAGNRLFYLATPPSAFATILRQLHQYHLLENAKGERWSRVIIEKPFGHDLPSAVALQEEIANYLDETQIYRIDHYLGKPLMQSILPFRQEHPEIEALLNRRHVSRVTLTLSEELGVGTRGRLLEESGLLRDLVQNHLMQMLTLLAMEPPQSLKASDIQVEKVNLLRAIRAEEIIRGQYGPGFIKGEAVKGYREEAEVASDSNVETYVAARLFIENERWEGVPFELKAGKRLDRSLAEIALSLHAPEEASLIFRIQPSPEISLAHKGKRASIAALALLFQKLMRTFCTMP